MKIEASKRGQKFFFCSVCKYASKRASKKSQIFLFNLHLRRFKENFSGSSLHSIDHMRIKLKKLAILSVIYWSSKFGPSQIRICSKHKCVCVCVRWDIISFVVRFSRSIVELDDDDD
ncbi:hypothetical protein BpHYR1_047400 [Brachionus plicatilis]|uniref:Uncharacterized protein n=1 Tax=Brachionus plicatilis TaxID=10195 RepID=A0A3M7T630_BRAPC|nr:hypothetical protein BpHYR1_047400 [Brachionus plicatilis]